MTTSFLKKYLFSLVLISSLLLNFGCKKDTTQPPDDKPATCTYPAGNRNFTWRIDTVAWWPSTVGGVWAFSDNDAYVLGTIVDGKPPYESRWGRHWNDTVWEDNINAKPGYKDNVGNWIDGDISIAPRNDVTGDDHFMVAVGFWGIDQTIYAGIAEFDNSKKKWKSYKLQAAGELRSAWTDGKGFFIAAGDNGMVYTKDGYTAEWVYQKAPSGFNFVDVKGISKYEVYALGDSAIPGRHYQQIWKYSNDVWSKLMDNFDTTNTAIRIPETGDDIYNIAVYRCTSTDSFSLYIVGRESFEFTAKGNSLEFVKLNLSSRGLPFSTLHSPAGRIYFFSPNDYWISGLRYQIYHWNGSNFQKIEPIQTLPYGQLWGTVSRIMRNKSGKTWMVLEMNSQVYTVLQGIP